jgi:hypothetical protein
MSSAVDIRSTNPTNTTWICGHKNNEEKEWEGREMKKNLLNIFMMLFDHIHHCGVHWIRSRRILLGIP